MRSGLFEIGVKERPQAGPMVRLKEVRHIQTRARQFLRRQIAPATPEVGREVAQDVYQLQAFSKPHRLGEQEIVLEPGLGENVSATHARPELADAAGYAV